MTPQQILKQCLDKSGLTIEDFAKSLGLKKRTFENYLYGVRKVPSDLLVKILNLD